MESNMHTYTISVYCMSGISCVPNAYFSFPFWIKIITNRNINKLYDTKIFFHSSWFAKNDRDFCIGTTRRWFSKLLWTPSLFSKHLIHSFLMGLVLLLSLKAPIWSAWTSQIGIQLSCEKITYTFRIVALPNSIMFPTDISLNLKSDFSWDVWNCTITAQIKPEAHFF